MSGNVLYMNGGKYAGSIHGKEKEQMQHGWIQALLTTTLLAAGVCGYHGGMQVKIKDTKTAQTAQVQQMQTNGQNAECLPDSDCAGQGARLRDGSCGNECVNQGVCLQDGDCAGQGVRLRDGSCADDCVNAGVCPRDGSGRAARVGASR